MPEKNRGIKPTLKIRIARNPVFIDGCEDASFIQVPAMGLRALSVIYALLDRPGRYTHAQIYEEGIEAGLISGNIEPTGGGIIDLQTYEYRGSSIHYGEPDKLAVEKLTRYLQRRKYGRDCD